MSTIVDLRSDTVTRPTLGMRNAMMDAPLGDDVFGDDPTVNALQEKAARKFGMKAALFCPSGTMTNQIAFRVHAQAGSEVIMESFAHPYRYEGGGLAANSGLSVALIDGNRGRINAQQIAARINNPDDVHQPLTKVVSLENTCNRGGGAIYGWDEILSIHHLCKEKGLKLHLDGARLFNAIVETDQSAEDFGKHFDSISICLSKGLGAPVGSLLLGDVDFIRQAKRVRKWMGGGMRQAGFLAAAGIYAMDHHVGRLVEDHARARAIGKMAESCPYIEEVLPVDTNIVIMRLAEGIQPTYLLDHLKSKDVWAVGFGGQLVRMVTHLDVTDSMLSQVETALKSFRS
jgi:threonine aldolase